MITMRLPRVASARCRRALSGLFNARFIPRVELLEPRLALCGAGCLEVPLIPELDQFGNQLETVMAYKAPGETDEQARISFAIYDTGASVATYSAADQLLYELLGSSIPIKVPGGASADAIGGVLTGDVSEPGEIIAAGLNAVTITDDFQVGVNFDPQIDLDGDGVADPTSVRTPGVQAFIGTVDGSPILPTITGTVVHSPSIHHPSGVAVQIDMTAYQLDFGALFPEIPEFEGIVVDLPDLYFIEPGKKLTSPDETITDPVRIPLELWGDNNYADPGDSITTTENPVQTGVALRHGGLEMTEQTLLFDTGAQLTVISTAIAEGLGLDLNAPDIEITVQGAAGQATIPGFTIDVFELPRDDDGDGELDGVLRFTDVPIYVLDVVPGLGGLIGMNLFNTGKEMLYDPFDPDGPSVQLTFFADPFRELPDPEAEEAIDMLAAANPLYGSWFGGQALPSFGIEIPLPPNQPPTPVDDLIDTTHGVASVVDVLANDSDPDGDPLAIVGVHEPIHGTAVIQGDNTIRYTPDVGYFGSDSFIYTVDDGNGGQATATVHVVILPPANAPPIAANDVFTLPAEVASVLDVLANDGDPDDDPLSIISVSGPDFGTAVLSVDASIVYTPVPGFTGAASFTYTVSDGNGGEDTATVTLTVAAGPNENPQAVDDHVETDENTPATIGVLANDRDLDGDPITVIATTNPASGSIVVHGDQTITYTPQAGSAGADSFTYTISDGNGGQDTATVHIVVNASPEHPWQNPNHNMAWDVDDNQSITIRDLLALVSALRDHGLDAVLPPADIEKPLPRYPDVNGNDRLDLGDLLATVQKLRDDLSSASSGEGEEDDLSGFELPQVATLEEYLDAIAVDMGRRS